MMEIQTAICVFSTFDTGALGFYLDEVIPQNGQAARVGLLYASHILFTVLLPPTFHVG